MTYDESSSVTYLGKSEGRRGEALRAEERGTGGDGERQVFDRGFKYLCLVSNGSERRVRSATTVNAAERANS
jgi:hypothetical protein